MEVIKLSILRCSLYSINKINEEPYGTIKGSLSKLNLIWGNI